MFRVLPNFSLYASYSESFESSLGRSFAGHVFDPALGKQYEIGAKGSLTPELQSSTAVFDLRKTNLTWSASLGSTYVGERYADLFNRNHIPSSVVWDAGARYAISKNDTLQLAVKNLANRRYIEDALDTDQVYPGTPRAVSLRYSHTF